MHDKRTALLKFQLDQLCNERSLCRNDNCVGRRLNHV